MITTIRLSAGLRTVAGAKVIGVPVPPGGATVRDLLAALWQANPALAAHVLTPEGTLTAGIMMLVRGRHIDFQQGFDTVIGEGEDVMLIPPLSGG